MEEEEWRKREEEEHNEAEATERMSGTADNFFFPLRPVIQEPVGRKIMIPLISSY